MRTYAWMFVLLCFFSIAMAFMESAIVVYLRALYYPQGFAFPLSTMDDKILYTELLREAATLVMLLTIGLIAGRNAAQKFVLFLFCFAIWDIFYYIFLWVLIQWPASLFTWDILFLLPVPWVGPVLAPVIISLTMISLTVLIFTLHVKGYYVSFNWIDWMLMVLGSLVLIISFTSDYFIIILNAADQSTMMNAFKDFTPDSYNWNIFILGELLIVADFIYIFYRRSKYTGYLYA